jgi:hypothetical protein
MNRLRFFFIFFVVVSFGCKNDKIKPLVVAPITCGDFTHVSFINQVQPIINANCINCHDASSGIKLNNYENISAFAKSGQLFGCLSGDQNYQQMPPTGSLDSCSVKAIKFWVQQGMLNN